MCNPDSERRVRGEGVGRRGFLLLMSNLLKNEFAIVTRYGGRCDPENISALSQIPWEKRRALEPL